jgi:hypothetical protein
MQTEKGRWKTEPGTGEQATSGSGILQQSFLFPLDRIVYFLWACDISEIPICDKPLFKGASHVQ